MLEFGREAEVVGKVGKQDLGPGECGDRPTVGSGDRPTLGTGDRPTLGIGDRPTLGTEWPRCSPGLCHHGTAQARSC